MEVLNWLLIFIASIAAGFINIMAGGGSMLTIGLMILLGYDPQLANGTNRIGVLIGALSGAATFKSEKFSDMKTSFLLAAFAIPGAIIGSIYSVKISAEAFEKSLAIVMIFIILTMFLPKGKRVDDGPKTSFLIYPAMLFVGFYGGFIQVGVGFLLMASLKHLSNFDLVRVNMHKTFIVLIYTLPVILVFGISGKIDIWLAAIISGGNAIGSYISVKLAIKKGEKLVKIILAVSVLLMAVKFLV